MLKTLVNDGPDLAIVLTPCLTLALGLFPSRWLNRHGHAAAATGTRLACLSLGSAGIALFALAAGSPVILRLWSAGPLTLTLTYDHLSALLLLLVSYLTAVITRYSESYLAGDPRQGRFTKWLCLTAGSVQALVLTGNLLDFALAWTSVSLCLHQLLIFYPERAGALLAARKKFIFSRLGDLCLLGTLLLVYQKFQTWDFAEVFRLATQTTAGPHPEVSTIGFLLAATALLKSAQFPFHSWLPDTMETPTPVSALMHAGIINGGGFLVVRFSPLLIHCPAALLLLAVLGSFTALFASLTMLTHASVKRALAFSTVAQMGFMMLECGLGAFSLAALHLTAHSLYKAHAFLSSGNRVQLHRSAWVPEGEPRSHRRLGMATLLAAAVVMLTCAWLLGIPLLQNPGSLFLALVLWFSLAYMLWSLWSLYLRPVLVVCGLLLAAGVACAGFILHRLFEAILRADLPTAKTEWNGLDAGLACFPLLLFLAVLVFQTQLPVWSRHPLCRALYVHARNGFYFTTLANRLVSRGWPLTNAPAQPFLQEENS